MTMPVRPTRPKRPKGDARPGSAAEPPDEREVADDLAHRRLAVAGRPYPETERDLGHGEAGRADEDLEQDLEAVRTQRREIERVAPDEEEARERITDRAQPAREGDARKRDERLGHQGAHLAQALDRASVVEARRHDEVALGGLGLCAQGGDRRGRVLKVGIHHAHPGCARCRNSRHDGSTETTVSLPGGTMDDRDVDLGLGAVLVDDGRRSVVGIVDDDQLGVNARQRFIESLDECADDGLFVARRRDDRDLGDACVCCHAPAACRSHRRCPGVLVARLPPVAGCHAGVRLLVWCVRASAEQPSEARTPPGAVALRRTQGLQQRRGSEP